MTRSEYLAKFKADGEKCLFMGQPCSELSRDDLLGVIGFAMQEMATREKMATRHAETMERLVYAKGRAGLP